MAYQPWQHVGMFVGGGVGAVQVHASASFKAISSEQSGMASPVQKSNSLNDTHMAYTVSAGLDVPLNQRQILVLV